MNIKETANFPAITRTGRVSSELQQIIDCLVESSKTDKSYVIEGVTSGNAYNSMQQRIRTQAKKLNFKVRISHDKNTNELYFKVVNESLDMPVATSTSTKGKTKKSADSSL